MNEDEDWRSKAECLGIDNNFKIFFPDADDLVTIAKAKSICYRCTVRDECLAYAYATRARDGIWGGVYLQRAASHKKRRCSRCDSSDLMRWNGKIECTSCGLRWEG